MRLPFLLVSIFLLGHLFTSCSQPNNRTPEQARTSHTVEDTADFAVIAFDQNHDWPFKHTYKPTALTEREIQLVDSLMKQCVMKYNQNLAVDLQSSYSIDFKKYKYKRQYMAVLNDKGQKEVLVNGFCKTWTENWRTDLVLVDDGGNCFFNLKVNLTTKECSKVVVNGYA